MNADCVLEGEKVRLRPVEEGDLPHFLHWLSDPEVHRWLMMNEPPTMEQQRGWWEGMRADPGATTWALETRKGKLEYAFVKGEFRNSLVMAVLRGEFLARRGRR